MIRNNQPIRHRRGTAAVEMALLLPVLLTLLAGIWEVARLVQVQEILASAAREAGRQAATGQMTNANVKKVALHHINNEGIQVTDGSDNPLTGVVVTVTDNTSTGTDASQANKLDALTISVTVPYTLVQWSNLNKFASSGTTINATVKWYSMNNAAFNVDQTIPAIPQ